MELHFMPSAIREICFGYALATASLYKSEAIFLFGGLAQAGELIFNPTIFSFEKNLLPFTKEKQGKNITFFPSEDDAAILGAASLVWQE